MNAELAAALIGLTKDKAIALCEEKNVRYRIVREDKNNYIVTHDFIPERINLSFDNNICTNVKNG